MALASLMAVLLLATPAPVFGQQRGGTMNVVLVSEPPDIDSLTGRWNSAFIGAQIFEPLLQLDEKLNSIPALATSYEINAADKSYKFTLRKGVKWHDGSPFTAQDVKFSFENIISRFGAFGPAYFKDTKVTIVDDSTVVIKPGTFFPGVQLYLISSQSAAIYPKHKLEGQDFLKSTFRTTDPVGTGAFKMKAWVRGSHIELIRNEVYWGQPRPFLERIIIRFISDPAAIIAGLKRGEIDYIFRGVPFEAVDDLKRTQGLKFIPSERPPYVAALWINVKANAPLSNVKVRQAIAYAIDRDDIARKATLGISPVVQYMIDPEAVPPSPRLTVYKYDPQTAEKLLDEAGFPRKADGKRFTIELMTRTGEPDEQTFALLVKDQLAKVGIDVNIKTVDFATYLKLQTQFQYEMATVKYWTPPFWAYQLFHTDWIGKGIFTNNFQYSNPELDRLFNAWLVETDPRKQVELMQKVEDILSRDLPIIVLYKVVWPNVVSDKFSGKAIPVGRYVFFDPLAEMYYAPIQPTLPIAADPTLLAGLIVVVIGAIGTSVVLLKRRTRAPKLQ